MYNFASNFETYYKMNSKNRYLYLIFGLIIGIAIGGASVWWLQNYDLKVWFSFSGKNKINLTGSNTENDSILVESKSKTNSYNYNNKKNNLLQNSSDEDTLSDNSSNNINNDTIKVKRSDEDIVVVKDELIFTKNYKVEGITDANYKRDAAYDSLLIDDKNTKHLPVNTIHVEFWKSPINYKGYKFLNNKLILFGIYQYDFAAFEFKNGNLYLTYLNNYYPIEKTNEFKQLLSIKKPVKQNKN